MNKNCNYRIWVAMSIFVLAALSCNLTIDFGGSTPASESFQLPTGIPPSTAQTLPTNPPPALDTAAPAIESTVSSESGDLMAEVQDYYQKGYLPFRNGQLYLMDDFSRASLPSKIFDFERSRQQAQDFALWADIELDSKGSTRYPDYTGCGFAYRVQNNDIGYTAILTNTAVRVGYCKNGMTQCELFGTTFGTGEVDVRNKTRTQFLLTVNKDVAHVLVNGALVGQYSLFTTKLLGMGEVYYAAVSNLNADYWTTCQISNVRLWESVP